MVAPDYPKRLYVESETTLVFDGKTVSIRAEVRCERHSLYDASGKVVSFADRSGPLYGSCRPRWIGTRLPDGSALFISPFGQDGEVGQRSFDALSVANTEPIELPPEKALRTVIWLSAPPDPVRADVYFSSLALEDPSSRLTSIDTGVLGLKRGFFDGDHRARDFPNHSPAIGPEMLPDRLETYYALTVPYSIWSQVPGLEATLGKFDTPVLLDRFDDLPDDQGSRLGLIASLTPEVIDRTLRLDRDEKHRGHLSRYQLFHPYQGYLRAREPGTVGVLTFYPTNLYSDGLSIELPIDGVGKRVSANSIWQRNTFLYDPVDRTIHGFLITALLRNRDL